jgi:hypothetical protein
MIAELDSLDGAEHVPEAAVIGENNPSDRVNRVNFLQLAASAV